jgi:hypothetical protein
MNGNPDGLKLFTIVSPALQEGHILPHPCSCSQQSFQAPLHLGGLQLPQQFSAAGLHPL